MSIVLRRLTSIGAGKPDALIDFNDLRTLVRGPSDTGKSYVRECLLFLLGGDKIPRALPEAVGYEYVVLTLTSGENSYEFRRGLIGGVTVINELSNGPSEEIVRTAVARDAGELVVELAGASGKQILRNKSAKGPVTSSDLRHWFLVSQPNMISEEPTYKTGYDSFQRIAAFNLFLTGNDDHAFELAATNNEIQRTTGRLQLAEEQLHKLMNELGVESRAECEDQLSKVDATLAQLKHQYEQRASMLRDVRKSVSIAADNFAKCQSRVDHRRHMVERFQLLQSKYESDIGRLTATWEGMAVFESLASVSCPLCDTPIESQVNPSDLQKRTRDKFRSALRAEIGTIEILREGLVASLDRGQNDLRRAEDESAAWRQSLQSAELLETKRLNQARTEFSADPEVLAIRRSELVARLQRFDERETLESDIAELRNRSKKKNVPLRREAVDAAHGVATIALEILKSWGFDSIRSVRLDPDECDLVIDDRPRLGFGAGKRALFLSALSVALLRHSLENNYPHLGLVALDSPLKAYSDPKARDADDIPLATVTERFYTWLSRWGGPGQVIVLENQEVSELLAGELNATQFTGITGDGRAGFYPPLAIATINSLFGDA